VSTARHPKHKIEDKPAVKLLFAQMLDLAGVSDELLAKRAWEGLHATAVHHATLQSDREVLIDFSERREMLELTLKLKGHLIDKHELRMVKSLEEILDESCGLA